MERKRIICSVPILGVLALALAGCGTGTPNGGTLTSALDNSAWSASQWISAKNAWMGDGQPVVRKVWSKRARFSLEHLLNLPNR